MKKILIVITTDMSLCGGLSTVALNYFRHMPKNDMKIDFASTNVCEIDLLIELSKYGSEYFCLGNRKKKLVHYIAKLYLILRKGNYDIIHIHGNSSTMAFELIAAMFARVNRRLVHVHTTQSDYPLLHKVMYPFFNILYTDAIAVSRSAGDWLYGEKKYMILNNAIDLNVYKYDYNIRERVRKKYQVENKFVIGTVGKLTDSKNHLFMLELFEEVLKNDKDCMLMIVGDGEYRELLIDKANKLSIRDHVIFIGMVNDASDYYQAFDLFLFTSKFEGFGLALLEAQATGLPCVVSDKVPLETKLSNNITYLSLNSSIKDWIQAIFLYRNINREYSSNDNKKIITENGFDIEREADKLYNMYV